MGDLDEHFGPRTESPETVLPGRTSWPRVSEHLRPFLDEYERWTRFHPHGQVAKLWVTGARQWVSSFGEGSLGLFKAAMRHAEANGLKPKSPAGLLYYGIKVGGKPLEKQYNGCPECGRIGSHAEGCPNE